MVGLLFLAHIFACSELLLVLKGLLLLVISLLF